MKPLSVTKCYGNTKRVVTQNERWYSSFANQTLFYGRNGRVINPNKTQTPKGNNWKLNPDFTLPSIFRIAHIPIWSMAKTRRSARTSAGWSRWAGEWLFGNTFQHHNESHLHKMEILTTFTAFVGHSLVMSGNSKLREAWSLFINDVKGKALWLWSTIIVNSRGFACSSDSYYLSQLTKNIYIFPTSLPPTPPITI